MGIKYKWLSRKCSVFLNCLLGSHRIQWLILLASMSIFTCIFLREAFNYEGFTKNNELVSRLREMIATEVSTGCLMPDLEPFSEEAMKFNIDDEDFPKIECDGTDWVTCYKSKCSVSKQILNRMRNIKCTYKDIIYLCDDNYYFGESTNILGGNEYILNRSDHVKVSCKGIDNNGFGLFFSRWTGNRAGLRPIEISSKTLDKPSKTLDNPSNIVENSSKMLDNLNILIIIFDSASKNGFIRRMPQSFKVLTDELKAVVLKKYNIVGDGTSGNLFPVLTGHMELEDSNKATDNKKYVDVKPFLFNILKEYGYRTAYFEDMTDTGTFQDHFNGFKHQPIDHYLRPFFWEEGNGWWNARQKNCVGAEPRHQFLMNITKQFFELQGKKFCVSFLRELSHDNFNFITAADEDLVTFLRTFRYDGRLKDTILIVMGDHGAHDSIWNSYQGKIEERLPLLSIVLPERLNKERPEAIKNLRANMETLTTHYDMHTTLLDALGLNKHRNRYKVPRSDVERGLSLLQPIPKLRSCAEAGIMPHWCACAKWHNVFITDAIYKEAAAALAVYINSISEEKRSKCAERKLLAIEWVIHLSPSKLMFGYNRYIGRYEENMRVRADKEYYKARIVMGPGRSVFEGMMKYIVKDGFFVIFEKDISRMNAYSDEPKCVSSTHPHLNKYCYCRDRLKVKLYNLLTTDKNSFNQKHFAKISE